jgi:hypothetical protein
MPERGEVEATAVVSANLFFKMHSSDAERREVWICMDGPIWDLLESVFASLGNNGFSPVYFLGGVMPWQRVECMFQRADESRLVLYGWIAKIDHQVGALPDAAEWLRDPHWMG